MSAAPLWKPIATGAAAALAVATAGALVTDLSPWYYALEQPAWKPPDWLFAPAWTTIFALAAASGITGWRALRNAPTARLWLLVMFAMNATFNVLWSGLFFRLHRPDIALFEVAFLWLSVAFLIVLLWRPSKAAALLLIPYLAWVSFAAVLNYAVVQLNGPFA